MGYQVYKFGGSSLADEKAIGLVVEIIRQRPQNLCVVVSAMGGITDTLDMLARQASKGIRSDEESQLDILYQRHKSVIEKLVSTEKQGSLMQEWIKLRFSSMLSSTVLRP